MSWLAPSAALIVQSVASIGCGAFGGDGLDCAGDAGRHQHLLHDAVAGQIADGRAGGQRVAGFDQRPEGQSFDWLCLGGVERPQQTVEDVAEQMRPEPHRHRSPGAAHRVARAHAGGIFVDLADQFVVLKPDDFAGAALRADFDGFADAEYACRAGIDHRAADPSDCGFTHARFRVRVRRATSRQWRGCHG